MDAGNVDLSIPDFPQNGPVTLKNAGIFWAIF
jgi:hypothetical protein